MLANADITSSGELEPQFNTAGETRMKLQDGEPKKMLIGRRANPTDCMAGKVLTEARRAANLSRRQVAVRMQRSPSFIWGLESGTVPARPHFRAYACALQLDPQVLFAQVMRGEMDKTPALQSRLEIHLPVNEFDTLVC